MCQSFPYFSFTTMHLTCFGFHLRSIVDTSFCNFSLTLYCQVIRVHKRSCFTLEIDISHYPTDLESSQGLFFVFPFFFLLQCPYDKFTSISWQVIQFLKAMYLGARYVKPSYAKFFLRLLFLNILNLLRVAKGKKQINYMKLLKRIFNL